MPIKKMLIATLLLSAACRSTAPEPVDLAVEDMCARCRMAISERRFAAEIVARDGEALKFDDIACMVSYVNAGHEPASSAAYFVMDYEARKWIKAEGAYFVQSAEFKAPMGGGIVAFMDKPRAEQAAARVHGIILAFRDVLRRRE